jgi:malonyl-CoA decarboxylase
MSSSFPQTQTPPWPDRLWASITPNGSTDTGRSPRQRVQHLAEALLSERGEASGAILARELHNGLRSLNAAERLVFYRFLAAGSRPDGDRLREAAEAYLADGSAEAAARLAKTADPPRQELLRRMNMPPDGTEALVALRKELLGHLGRELALKLLDADLRHLFASWFNRGFLELRRIDWRSPVAILEKLIAYEAVHEIRGWDDLRRRLAADRLCFGFFHPALPGEPLIFVEVALIEGLAAAVQPLLARDDGDAQAARARAACADTAIFYSISNCQDGLRGVSFGNFPIKQVVEELKAELPHLTRFATLSPVPGFRRWLKRRLDSAGTEAAVASTAMFGEHEAKQLITRAGDAVSNAIEAFRALADNREWWHDAAHGGVLQRPLLRLPSNDFRRRLRRKPDR